MLEAKQKRLLALAMTAAVSAISNLATAQGQVYVQLPENDAAKLAAALGLVAGPVHTARKIEISNKLSLEAKISGHYQQGQARFRYEGRVISANSQLTLTGGEARMLFDALKGIRAVEGNGSTPPKTLIRRLSLPNVDIGCAKSTGWNPYTCNVAVKR